MVSRMAASSFAHLSIIICMSACTERLRGVKAAQRKTSARQLNCRLKRCHAARMRIRSEYVATSFAIHDPAWAKAVPDDPNSMRMFPLIPSPSGPVYMRGL